MTVLRGDGHEALRSAVLDPHAPLDDLAAAIGRAHPSAAEPRRIRELADTFMATASRHLAAVDDSLLAVARHQLSEGHHVVAAYVTQAREFEHSLHSVKAWMYGDANAHHLKGDTLWADVRRLLAEHETREAVLVDDLGALLADEDLTDLAERLHRGEKHACTRPHPYAPHTGLAGRLLHRALSVADRFWDNAESRVIPQPRRPAHPRRDSLLTRYVLGAPRFEELEGERRP